MTTYYTLVPSPVGPLLLTGDGESLQGLHFSTGAKKKEAEAGWRNDAAPFREVIRQLDAYFKGALHDFDVPLAPLGTPFQRNVWSALREIPYGRT
ncbi:MAG: hypothetical protein SFV51_25785, partial [Bryobacteraceae bacterium]|nr:hypothetical protein [Bryobacteraceae bacterium]